MDESPWNFYYDSRLNRCRIDRGGTDSYMLWDGLNLLEERTIYPLWMFGDDNLICLTRGRTQEEAARCAATSFKRGNTITYFDFCPISAAKLYSEKHAPGWLHRMPEWLRKETHANQQRTWCVT